MRRNPSKKAASIPEAPRSRGILTLDHSQPEFGSSHEWCRRIQGRMVAMPGRHFAKGQHIGSITPESVGFPAVLPAPTFAPGLPPGNTGPDLRPMPILSGI